VVNVAEAKANAATASTSAAGEAGGSHGKYGPKSKRRRRLVIAGGILTIGATAITVGDDAKHAYTATKRSYRVLETLVLNIREYVHSNCTNYS
jgi:aarF domain-containing kinase